MWNLCHWSLLDQPDFNKPFLGWDILSYSPFHSMFNNMPWKMCDIFSSIQWFSPIPTIQFPSSWGVLTPPSPFINPEPQSAQNLTPNSLINLLISTLPSFMWLISCQRAQQSCQTPVRPLWQSTITITLSYPALSLPHCPSFFVKLHLFPLFPHCTNQITVWPLSRLEVLLPCFHSPYSTFNTKPWKICIIVSLTPVAFSSKIATEMVVVMLGEEPVINQDEQQFLGHNIQRKANIFTIN